MITDRKQQRSLQNIHAPIAECNETQHSKLELNQGETAFVKMSKQVPNFPDPDRDMMSLNSQRDIIGSCRNIQYSVELMDCIYPMI